MAEGGNHANKGPRAIRVKLPKQGEVTIYGNAKVANALEELTTDMDLYDGVRLGQVIEAAYDQGAVDARSEVREAQEELWNRKELKHRNPGRPPKKK